MSTEVLALVQLDSERLAALTAGGYRVREGAKYANRTDALRDGGDKVRAVLTNGRHGLSGSEMDLLPNLEIVCATGAGYEAIDLESARNRGVAVGNSSGANASVVADSAMMLLLATARHIHQADRFVRSGGWQDRWQVETPAVSGKRLGILGLGTIGKHVAQRAACGFSIEIGYHNRKSAADSTYRFFDNLVELAVWADFLIVTAPGGTATRHLVNAQVLNALGPKGYLVNVGRGTIVDTDALIDALRTGQIAGAGLDVLEGEGDPSVQPQLQSLLKFDNLVMTPHCAGRAPESRVAATNMILANLDSHFSGKPLPSPVA